jgi:hypothetical protein
LGAQHLRVDPLDFFVWKIDFFNGGPTGLCAPSPKDRINKAKPNSGEIGHDSEFMDGALAEQNSGYPLKLRSKL